MHRLLLTLIAITGICTTTRAQCPPWHLNIAQEIELGCVCGFCFQCAQQGVAADPAGNAFFTSTGATKAKNKVLTKFDSNWTYIDHEPVNYDLFIDHIGDIAVVGNFVYAPLQGNTVFGDNINLLHVAWFNKNTLEHVDHTDIMVLENFYGIGDGEDGGIAGVAHRDGKLYVVEYQKALPDSPTPHIFRFNLLGNGALDMSNWSAFQIPTRYANGIEIIGAFVLVSYGSNTGDDAGSIDVYHLNNIPAGPVFTWTFDVHTWHAEGLTYANNKLWVAQGSDVHRLHTNNAPGFPEGLIEDCFGNCAPVDWVGDGICDDGWRSWDGNLIHFDCEEFDSDGGDCDDGGGGSDYTFCCSAMCLDADENPPYDCFDATPTVGIDDERVYAWFRLSEICVPIFGARWEWFRPDGSLWGDVTGDASCDFGGCDGPCTWWWWIPVAGTGNADWAGVWQVKMYVDAGSGWEYLTTEQFVMSYDLTEHLMCQDVQKDSPWDPINPTTTFYQTSEKAVSWLNLDLVANALDVKWEWYEPNGSVFDVDFYTIPDANDDGYDYWNTYRTWSNLYISGGSAASKCGQWEVQFYVEDPFGNWELEYSDGFVVLEDPNVDPIVTVVSSPQEPEEGEPISLIVSATDNTYLHHVTLSWFDDQWHDVLIGDEIFAGSFNDSLPIGSFPEGQEIMFFAEAVDTSGNATASEIQTIIVGRPPPPPPCDPFLYVPPYPSIQAAIDAACDDSAVVVVVYPGTYYENINFLGKAITVVGVGGPEVTIIDGQFNGSVVTCDSGEGPETVLQGFTIRFGLGTVLANDTWGGGMFNYNASPTIINCKFFANFADYGAGMANFGDPFVIDCVFTDNLSTISGGGMLNWGSSPSLSGCIFTNNSAVSGGGMSNLLLFSSPTVTDCTFSGNTADWSGGAIYNGVGEKGKKNTPIVAGSIFCENIPNHIGGDPIDDAGGNCFADSCADANGNGIPDECEVIGDLDGDGSVGASDLLILLANWGPCGDCNDCSADLDDDCSVGASDLLILLANWG